MYEINSFMAELERKNPAQSEFIQAVREVVESVIDVVNENPVYLNDFARIYRDIYGKTNQEMANMLGLKKACRFQRFIAGYGKIYGDSIATDNAKIYGSIHGTVSVIGNAVVPKYVDISSDNKILIIKSNDNNETVIG